MSQLVNLVEYKQQLEQEVQNANLTDCVLPESFKNKFTSFHGYNFEYYDYTLKVSTSQGECFIPNQWIFIGALCSQYHSELLKYKEKLVNYGITDDYFRRCHPGRDDKDIPEEERTQEYLQNLARTYLENYQNEDKELLINFLWDYDSWGGGKNINRGDFTASPVLSIAHSINASSGLIGIIAQALAEDQLLRQELFNSKEWGQLGRSNQTGINPDGIIHTYKSLPLQQIFYGAPGTGKSHRIKEIIKEHGIDEKEQVIRTTFHPDSDYSTFVGCYKPIMKSVPQTYVVEGNEKPVMADKDNQATKEEVVYDYTPQAFVQAYTKAWTTDKPVILVIEEINRGNCAQIFGDIFQLLDRGKDNVSEYEIKPDKALENYLREYFAAFEDVDEQIKSGRIMKLPSNLYIWATMNTSDQSLFPIDSAFKRRWEWKYIKIAWPYKKNEDGSFKTDENGEKVHFNYSIEGGHDWWKFLQQINAIIDKMTNSADKQLGYFFAKAKDGIISYDTFVSKVCFYLWNDIFKTYALDEQQGDLFKFAKKIKDKDENEKEVIGHLTFPEFYDGDGNVVTDVAKQFIEHVMAWNTEGKKENS